MILSKTQHDCAGGGERAICPPILSGRHALHQGCVTSAGLEHRTSNVGPSHGLAGIAEVVGPVGRFDLEQVNDGAADFGGEGESAELIIHNLRIHAAVCEGGHRAHKVVAVADHPAGPQQVVRGQGSDLCVTGCFCLPVDAER